MPYDPREKFVQPADAIVLICSPGMTAAQIAEIERQRQERIKQRIARERAEE